jgi:hypothetical protein
VYVAVIVGVPAAVSVYVTEHVSEARVHVPVNEPVDGSEVVSATVCPSGTPPVIVAVQDISPVTVNVEGVHDTANVVGSWTVAVVVPVALAYVPSVVYVAVIVGVPAAVSVYVTEHVSEARVHVPMNEPVDGSEVVSATVCPSGTPPVIVAVQVVDPAVVNVEGVHDTANVVVVAACARLSIANSAMMAVIDKDVTLFLIFPLSSFVSVKER